MEIRLRNFHSCTVHLDTIESFIYPTDAQLDCSKNVKIYMRGAATCFGFPQPSSGSYCMCFAKGVIINPLNPELNPICYLLALLSHHFLHVSRIRVKSLTLRLLMSYIYIYIYIYGAPILDVSRSHTTTQHSR